MPLQNRVDPWGRLHAVEARGAWMGNRGILHDGRQRIVAPWRHQAWIVCRLAYKGRHREVFQPNRYSEIFFLDEATAFSAGHRPCAQCRNRRYKELKAAWCKVNASSEVDVRTLDRRLHQERAVRGGGKVVFEDVLDDLPPGTFIEWAGAALLLWHDHLFQWSFSGYASARSAPSPSARVQVLTPASVVATYRSGFAPQVHESADP